MSYLKPNVIVTLRLLATAEGGRKTPIMGSAFNCRFEHSGETNDCRILMDEAGDFWPGQRMSVPIKFLYPDLVMPRLQKGDRFSILEIGIIGDGVIDEILWE